MEVTVFSSKEYERYYLEQANAAQHQFHFINDALSLKTALQTKLASAVCCFVTDDLSRPVLEKLVEREVKLIALRTAGYDNVDIDAAKELGLTVVRIPSYSPEAIAEFAVALILSLARKILVSCERGQQFNYDLEGTIGFNLYEKTVGVIGTGYIGTAFAKIMLGFGCRVLAVDPVSNPECEEMGVEYVSLEKLYAESDIISLHCLLNEETHHMLNAKSFSKMKKSVMIINTARGASIDTAALISALESGQVAFAGLDVYEHEKGLFFIDHRGEKVEDQQLAALQKMDNVLITGHRAFFTKEAVDSISKMTIENISAFEANKSINVL